MPLTPGSGLGIHDVISLLGEGGMGQVWRARDSQFNRDVALKVLPEAFAERIVIQAANLHAES